MTLPLSYSRIPNGDERRVSKDETALSAAPGPPVTRRRLTGGQGRVRTSVGHMGRQIYSLLLLTAQPPVRNAKTQRCPRSARERKLPLPSDRLPDRHAAALHCRLNPARLYQKPAGRAPSRTMRPPNRGAGEGIRTPDPLITNQMLYQLSYASRPKPPNYMEAENELQETLLRGVARVTHAPTGARKSTAFEPVKPFRWRRSDSAFTGRVLEVGASARRIELPVVRVRRSQSKPCLAGGASQRGQRWLAGRGLHFRTCRRRPTSSQNAGCH